MGSAWGSPLMGLGEALEGGIAVATCRRAEAVHVVHLAPARPAIARAETQQRSGDQRAEGKKLICKKV